MCGAVIFHDTGRLCSGITNLMPSLSSPERESRAPLTLSAWQAAPQKLNTCMDRRLARYRDILYKRKDLMILSLAGVLQICQLYKESYPLTS